MDQNTKKIIDQLKNDFDLAIRTHTHDGNGSQSVNSLNVFADYKYILYRIVAPTTANAVATKVGGDLVMPFSGSVFEVGATVDTAGTTGTTQIDVNNNGTSILSTKITIDSAEKTSRDAATPSVINMTLPDFKVGDIFTFDVDTIQTTPALGLTVYLMVVRTI